MLNTNARRMLNTNPRGSKMTAPQPQPQSPVKKKGLHPAALVAIGCGGVLVVIAVGLGIAGLFVYNKVKDVAADFSDHPAMSAAALLVRMNPELDLVDRDNRNETLTIRHNETGQEIVVHLEDVQQGRLSFQTPEGDVDLQLVGGAPARVPAWIPLFPGAEVQGGWSASAEGEQAGGFTVTTDADGAALFEYYRSSFADAGFTAQLHMTAGGAADTSQGSTLIATSSDQRRAVSVLVAGSQAMINYTFKQ